MDRLLWFRQDRTPAETGTPHTIHYVIGPNLYGSSMLPFTGNYRPYTTWAHISGQVAGDLSATITIDYGDGGPPAVYVWGSPGIDPLTIPQGDTVALGATPFDDGPRIAYFDNFVLTPEPSTAVLLLTGALAMRRGRRLA